MKLIIPQDFSKRRLDQKNVVLQRNGPCHKILAVVILLRARRTDLSGGGSSPGVVLAEHSITGTACGCWPLDVLVGDDARR